MSLFHSLARRNCANIRISHSLRLGLWPKAVYPLKGVNFKGKELPESTVRNEGVTRSLATLVLCWVSLQNTKIPSGGDAF
jgi:hypothetical protein